MKKEDTMLDDTDVADRITALLVDRLGMPSDDVIPSANLAEDLGLDSVDAVTLILALEREFGVTLPDSVFGHVRTVQDVIDMIRMTSPLLAEIAGS
jgi:acyl carrier protein